MEYDKRDSYEIRKIIMDTLIDLRRKISLDYELKIEPAEHDENIILTLPREMTQIKKLDEENGGNYERSGARIVFHQIYSNGSEVSYQMSHIPGLADEPETELKDQVPREQVSREYIMEKVLAFLEEVIESEK